MQAKTNGNQRDTVEEYNQLIINPLRNIHYNFERNYAKFQMNYAYLAEDENSGTSKVLLCLENW